MKSIKVFIILVGIFLSSCMSTTEVDEFPPTQTPPPTKTNFPTPFLPSSTTTAITITPTRTPNPSNTPTTNAQATFDIYHTQIALSNTPTPLPPPPTITPEPYIPAYITGTPVLPLKNHTWTSNNILVELGIKWGDGCCNYEPVPKFILYADGLLIRSHDFIGYETNYKQLSSNNVCKFLNTIEQLGFLNYDPYMYQSPFAGGGGSTYIWVDSWKSKYVNHPDLSSLVYRYGYDSLIGCEDCPAPIILPAINNTYLFLDNFPSGIEPYKPDRVIVYMQLSQSTSTDPNAKDWPFGSPDLNFIYEKVQESPPDKHYITIVIEGPDAQLWMNAIGGIDLFFQEDGLTASTTTRYLWLHEFPEEDIHIGPRIVGTSPKTPTKPISCNASDGVYDLPEIKK